MSDADLAYDQGDEFILRDDKMFFDIVRSTPDLIEAMDLLRRAKVAVLREKEQALRDGNSRGDQAMMLLLSRLNAEFRYINEREERARVHDVIEEAFGKEGLELYRARKIARMFPDKEPF